MDNLEILMEPYGLFMEKNWEAVKKYFTEKDSPYLDSSLTVTKDTALHIAVFSKNKELLEILIKHGRWRGEKREGGWNIWGNTPLHEAAATGDKEMARILLKFDKSQLGHKNNFGETPLFRAAAFGRTDMVEFFIGNVIEDIDRESSIMEKHRRRKDSTSILHIAILGIHFDTALVLLKWDFSLRDLRDEHGTTCFQLLANMPSAFKSGHPMSVLEGLLYLCLPDDDGLHDDKDNGTLITSSGRADLELGRGWSCPRKFCYLGDRIAMSRIYYTVWSCIAQGFPEVRRLWDIKIQQKRVLRLATILAQTDKSWLGTIEDKEEAKEDGLHSRPTLSSETPLISAARNGITEIVEVILKRFPQAIEHRNDRLENILHIAARYRRKEILDLLQYLHVPTLRLKRLINVDLDTILHQAAYLGEHRLRDRPGEALRMQSEIQWFKRVQKLVPPHFIKNRNVKGQTAEELFTIQHKKLVEDGQEWLMRTAKACTIVAVLIATVAFTCAYTIPGGSNSRTGHPLLQKETPFRIFTISDTVSLCFSLTSVVVFLSIMTSRMHERDFRRSLPLKLGLGLTTLFFAVAAMMVAFAATLVLMMRQRLHWAAIPIYTITCCPVTVFIALQFPLYLNIAWFTFSDVLQSLSDSLPLGKCKILRSVE
nr:ankyrin repeat-containing protein itn1 [Quercus suber]